MPDVEQPDLTGLTVQLLSAYVSNNSVASEDLAKLIRETRAALTDSGDAKALVGEAAAVHVPAVSIRKSLASRDHIISLIDGKPYKTLKRHLASHGLTPVEYRERYSLPSSYPLVSPNYSVARRETAARIGLGRKPRTPEETAPVAAVAPAPVEQAAILPEVERKKPARGKAVKAAATAKSTKSSKAATTAVKKVSPEPVALNDSPAAIEAVTKPPRKSATKAATAKTPKTIGKKVGPAVADVAAPRTSAAKTAGKKASPTKGRDKTAIESTAADIAPAPKKKLGIRTAKADSATEAPAES